MDNFSTYMLRICLRVLGGQHPLRLAIGVGLGLVLRGLTIYLDYVIPGNTYIAGLIEVDTIYVIAFSVLAAFSPLVFKKRILPEHASTIFDIIDEGAARLGYSHPQRVLLYSSFFAKLLKDFQVDTVSNVGGLAREAVDEADFDSETESDH